MQKDPRIYLLDIMQAIADIFRYVEGIEKEDFIHNSMVQDAIIRKFAVIGEAVKKLPLSVKQKEKRIPWKRIAGMRDIVVHDYSDINLNVVWDTVKENLPKLDRAVQKLLKEKE